MYPICVCQLSHCVFRLSHYVRWLSHYIDMLTTHDLNFFIFGSQTGLENYNLRSSSNDIDFFFENTWNIGFCVFGSHRFTLPYETIEKYNIFFPNSLSKYLSFELPHDNIEGQIYFTAHFEIHNDHEKTKFGKLCG